MDLRHNQRGATLVELLAGTAIAGILLLAVTSMEIASWRYRVADELGFTARAEAGTLLDRFAQDMRQSRSYTLAADGASALTLNLADGTVTYQFDAAAKAVTRHDRVLMREAASLQFYREDGGRTVRAVIIATDGFQLESRATTRLGP